jgi:HEAT repeat protein
MLEYLKGCNDDDKKFIIDILGLIGLKTPIPDIINILKTTQNDNVILACLEAFGNLKAEESVSELNNYYDKNELFKPTIIEALGKIGSNDALEFVNARYCQEDDLTKFSIIGTLGEIGNEETFYFLLSEMNSVEGPLLWPIVSSIYMLKEKFGLDLPFDEKVRAGILYTLSDADTEMKKAAANLIVPFDDKEIITTFLKIYGEDPEIDDIAKQKVFSNKAPVLLMLIAILKGKPSNVKNLLWLIREMIDVASPEDFESLSPLDLRNLTDSFTIYLENPDEEVRKSAMELLFVVSVDTALLFLDVMASDDIVWNRIKLTELIENINSPLIDDVLKKLSEDNEEMVKERAQWILSQRGIN